MRTNRQLFANSNALVVFSAAARCGSFTRAGQELGMAQASVSYFIKQLEKNLGVTLFHRQHRRVELTEAGRRFYHQLATGFSIIENGLSELQQNTAANRVTISSSTAFASYWLLPRMAGFQARFPDVDLRIQTSDKDIDLVQESTSLGVLLGDGNFDKYDCELLAEEEIYAICRNDFFEHRVRPESPAQIAEYPLIHLDEPFRPRANWSDWFGYFDHDFVDYHDGLRLNDYALVIQAALENQGIALGWYHIAKRLLDSGLLVKAVPEKYVSGNGFYLIWPRNSPLSHSARIVRDWIVRQTR